MNASAERTALMQQREVEKAKALKRAVADIMEPGGEERSIDGVAVTRGVSEARLREALRAAGWQSRVKNPPGPRRRTFENGRRHATSPGPER